MHYHWHWDVLLQQPYTTWLLDGFMVTIALALIGWVIALVLGTLVGALRTGSSPVLRAAGALYVQQAQYDQSVGQYNQALLDAVRQVADVIANWRSLEREVTEQQTALEDAQRSYDLTTERYRAGLDNYLSVLSSQNQVLLAQGLRAELAAQRLSFSVDLVMALGGGYVPPHAAG